MNPATAFLISLLLCVGGAAQTTPESPSIDWPVYLASNGFPGLYQIEAEKPAGEAPAPVSPVVPPDGQTAPDTGQGAIAKQRVLGVLPNYRTADGTIPFSADHNEAKVHHRD